MSIKRIYPTQDTSVCDYDPAVPEIDPRGSNVGAAEIMNLYEWGTTRSEVLIKFDMNQLSGVPTGSHVFLHMSDAQHAETLPAGYDIKIRPLEQDWTEGDGLDIDTYSDIGAANFDLATSNTSWVLQTGTLSCSFSFITGREDVWADISILTSSMGHGLDIMVDPITLGSPYIKKFHSRQSHFPNKRPYLEAQWTDWTGSITTASLFCVTSGEYSGTLWPASMATTPASGSGSLITLYTSDVDPTGSLKFSLFNLQPTYNILETTNLNLQVQRWDWDPAVVLTASASTQSVILTECYYRVVDVLTNQEVIPFGTGSLKHTKLSYNDQGNYFDFFMGNLAIGPLYRFDFIYNAPTGSAEWTYVQGDAFKFRLTEVYV